MSLLDLGRPGLPAAQHPNDDAHRRLHRVAGRLELDLDEVAVVGFALVLRRDQDLTDGSGRHAGRNIRAHVERDEARAHRHPEHAEVADLGALEQLEVLRVRAPVPAIADDRGTDPIVVLDALMLLVEQRQHGGPVGLPGRQQHRATPPVHFDPSLDGLTFAGEAIPTSALPLEDPSRTSPLRARFASFSFRSGMPAARISSVRVRGSSGCARKTSSRRSASMLHSRRQEMALVKEVAVRGLKCPRARSGNAPKATSSGRAGPDRSEGA
ncbi:MAG: hypothetical protein HC923_13080 [Myxococcales bacterium]|nr:hypothetical protein [Myxococcales bacterium]